MTCTEATHSENAQSNDCNNRMRTEGYLIALRVFLRVYHPQQSVRDRRFPMKEKQRKTTKFQGYQHIKNVRIL